MKDRQDIRLGELSSEDSNIPEEDKGRGFKRGKTPFLILAIVVVLIAVGALFFFSPGGNSLTPEEAKQMQSKIMTLEQRIAVVERQVEDVNARMAPSGSEADLSQRVRELSQKVESLEKRRHTAAAKTKPEAPKPTVSTSKLSHTVQKGDTLGRISKKYGISLKELRKLNNLSESQGIRPGQKLLVSPGH